MPSFSDHFSAVADRYAAFRPKYPSALYEWVATLVPSDVLVWDCGAGSGQAAEALRSHFGRIIATDASERQLRRAPRSAGLWYAASLSEASALATASVGLTTVAQALHWFDIEKFSAELCRVMCVGGAVVAWSYGRIVVGAHIDEAFSELYETLQPYWPPERSLVDSAYANLQMPFEDVPSPDIRMTASWTLEQVLGYVRTWSAVSQYCAETGKDPISTFTTRLAPIWGAGGVKREVRWPLAIRAWRVSRSSAIRK